MQDENKSAEELTNQMLEAEFGGDDAEESTESEEVEQTQEESTDGTDESEDNEETDTDESEETEESEEASDDEQETEETPEQARKRENREQAARRVEEKRQREQQINDSQREHVEAAPDELERAVRELQVQQYNTTVKSNTDSLKNEYERAVNEYTDILTSTNPAIKSRVDRALDAFQAQSVRLDQYGNPTQVNSSLYEYLKQEAENIKELTNFGGTQQVKSKAKEKSKTLAPPSRSPKESKDTLMDALLSD